jgi:hypothetical protein
VLVVDEVVVVALVVLVGSAAVDDVADPATTFTVAAELFQCRSVPHPTLKIPILTVCAPSVSSAGMVQLVLNVRGVRATNDWAFQYVCSTFRPFGS